MRFRFNRHIRLFLTALLLAASAFAQTSSGRIRFRVTLSSEATDGPVSGRLLILMTTQKPKEGAIEPGFGKETNSVWIAARELRKMPPGYSVEIDPDEKAFPAPFSKAPAGDYYVMAMVDTDHNAGYNPLSPGDLKMTPMLMKSLNPATAGVVPLSLTQTVTGGPLILPQRTERLDFISPVLSRFWSRPVHMSGIVVLPPSYATSGHTYPTVYVNHGYGANMHSLAGMASGYQHDMAESHAPEMIYVLLLQQCPGGTHEFADSANNGPWGEALTTELIPYLESKYRMDAKPQGRFLTGHSSGGWATAWLQVTYPKIFGGAWATSPDPVDFRSFAGIDLTATPPQNLYRKADGSPLMLVRMGGKDVESMEEYVRQEAVLGDYGGQMESFEWVFSPRGADGKPAQLFNRTTGAINPAVAAYWQRYNISLIVKSHWKELAPDLDGKLHVIVGTNDTFHLDESVRLLESTMKELGAKAMFTYLEGRDHFNLYKGGLSEKIAREMYAVARPEGK